MIENEEGKVVPLARAGRANRDTPFDFESYEDDLEDEDEFISAWDAAEAQAVDLLRSALAEQVGESPPHDSLRIAAERLRVNMKTGWPLTFVEHAAGWKAGSPPDNDRELWLGAVGGLISLRDESGLDSADESTLMTMELADWVGAIVGLVRAGVGASADPGALVRHINECPEVDGEVAEDDESFVEAGFELILPAWEAAGALDERRRLTTLGRWGLPHALAWAWRHDFDRPTSRVDPKD